MFLRLKEDWVLKKEKEVKTKCFSHHQLPPNVWGVCLSAWLDRYLLQWDLFPRILWWPLPAGVSVPERCWLPQCDWRVHLCSRLHGNPVSNDSVIQCFRVNLMPIIKEKDHQNEPASFVVLDTQMLLYVISMERGVAALLSTVFEPFHCF